VQWRILALSLVIPRTISCIQKELWIILLDARSTFSPSIHISPLSIPTNIKFTTAQLLVKSLFVTSTTTKMNRAGTVVSSRGSIIYTGSIIVLDEQPCVYLIFGTTLTIICLTQRVNKYYATEVVGRIPTQEIFFSRPFNTHRLSLIGTGVSIFFGKTLLLHFKNYTVINDTFINECHYLTEVDVLLRSTRFIFMLLLS